MKDVFSIVKNPEKAVVPIKELTGINNKIVLPETKNAKKVIESALSKLRSKINEIGRGDYPAGRLETDTLYQEILLNLLLSKESLERDEAQREIRLQYGAIDKTAFENAWGKIKGLVQEIEN
jgi:hypothetical protein